MKNHVLLTIILLAALMLACSLSEFAATSPTEIPPTPIIVEVTRLVAADTATAPAATPLPVDPTATIISLPQSTATPSIPMVAPLKDPVNCRYGPSVNFEQVFALAVDSFAQVTGKSADGGWLQVLIPNGNGQNCWVANSVVITSGDMSGIMTVPSPKAFVTDVKFQVRPDSTNLGPGCSGPFPSFSFKGSISVNGPLEVKWHIETQQDGRLPDHTFSFSKFGTQEIASVYVPSSWKKGSFWVRLVITEPKSMLSEATYQVICK